MNRLEQRLPDWPSRVRATINAWRKKPPAGVTIWGAHDCAQMVLDVSKAIYGAHNVPEMAAGYDSYEGGYRLLRATFSSVEDMIEARSAGRIELNEARLGDIALLGGFGDIAFLVFLRRGRMATFSGRGYESRSDWPIGGVWRL